MNHARYVMREGYTYTAWLLIADTEAFETMERNERISNGKRY